MSFLPYVLLILVFVFSAILLLSSTLVPQDSITSYIKRSTIVPAMIIFMLFIFGLIAYGYASSMVHQSSTPGSTTSTTTTVNISTSFPADLSGAYILSILTAPSFLSLILTLITMAIAVTFMAREKK